MIKLSVRLQTIHDMVPTSVVADVGADHGKLMIALFESGRINRGYAIENKKGPYNRLVKALTDNHLEEAIIPLYSDGIEDLPSVVSTVVIAGMGGETIVGILKRHPEKLKYVDTIIVDAHSELAYLRDEISQMGYTIADEKIIKEDGVFYEIIKFIKSEIAFYSDKDLEFGPILRHEKCATFKEKYQNRINEIDNLLNTNSKLPQSRIQQLNSEKAKLQGVI